MDINCPNLNTKINRAINCSILALSQFKNDSINVKFDDGMQNFTFYMTEKVVNYFGLYDKHGIIDKQISTSFIGNFLLLNTEFKFDSYLVGIELFCINPGSLTVNVFSLNFFSIFRN